MESVKDIKEALSARSRTATLDELRNEGRKRVRVIRAEHIAVMVTEAVNAAVEQSGLIAPSEVNRLVEKSQKEFRAILKEREQEVERARDIESRLAERESQLAALQHKYEAASRALAEAQEQLARLRDSQPATTNLLATGQATPHAAATVGGNPPSGDLLMTMVQEMATLKANLMQREAQERAPAAAAPAGASDFTAAIEKLAGSLNDRIEKIGKKMGVSAAVESDAPLDFGNLFKDDGGKTLESNIDNIEVKQKSGGGIAANLARLKKLKGGK